MKTKHKEKMKRTRKKLKRNEILETSPKSDKDETFGESLLEKSFYGARNLIDGEEMKNRQRQTQAK